MIKKYNLAIQGVIFFFLGFIIAFPVLSYYIPKPEIKKTDRPQFTNLGVFNLGEKIEYQNRSVTLKLLDKKDSFSNSNKIILSFNVLVENNTKQEVSFCEKDFILINKENVTLEAVADSEDGVNQITPCNPVIINPMSIINKEFYKEIEKISLDEVAFLYFSPTKAEENKESLWSMVETVINLGDVK